MSTPQPNEHGVYQPSESITMPNPRPGWKGMPLAEIDLVQLPSGWRSAIGAQTNNRGRAEPITDRSVSHPTRDAAVAAAVARLRAWLIDNDDAQAALISRWLDTLTPDQLDLFGVAA